MPEKKLTPYFVECGVNKIKARSKIWRYGKSRIRDIYLIYRGRLEGQKLGEEVGHKNDAQLKKKGYLRYVKNY